MFSTSLFNFAQKEYASNGAFRLDAKQREATRSDAKQLKFDVIDSSRKVATARNLREQLRNSACLQAVVR